MSLWMWLGSTVGCLLAGGMVGYILGSVSTPPVVSYRMCDVHHRVCDAHHRPIDPTKTLRENQRTLME